MYEPFLALLDVERFSLDWENECWVRWQALSHSLSLLKQKHEDETEIAKLTKMMVILNVLMSLIVV